MDCSYVDFSVYGVSKRKYLLEKLEQEKYNLLCYSLDILTTTPKKGYDALWESTKENIRLIEQMLKELPDAEGYTFFVGQFMGYQPCEDMDFVMGRFEVATTEPKSESFYFLLTRKLYDEWVKNYCTEAEERRKQDKPCLFVIKVKKGEVLEIDWVDNWT
ncbi:hypothetical protein [Butyricicoccus pullicaecorum]|uniref:hypothetical protein n=1 Tax=Butyricicoccus pullicaecorum TaxID=501571 RepID=UPI00399047FB